MLVSNKADNNEMFNEYNKYLIRRLQMKTCHDVCISKIHNINKIINNK